MTEETTATTTAKKEVSKKKGMKPNKWMIGLILLVLFLGGLSFYQMKKNKELQEALKKKAKLNPDPSLDKKLAKGEDATKASDGYTADTGDEGVIN